MNRVFITSFSSISTLGIGIKESLKNLQSQKQLIQIPGENDKFNKPYFPIHSSLKLDNKKILCSQFALTLLELIKNNTNKEIEGNKELENLIKHNKLIFLYFYLPPQAELKRLKKFMKD